MSVSYEPQIAVLGCGGWGRNIVRTLAGLGALRAVVDPCESGRAQAESIAPGIPVSGDPATILDDEQVRGVMIATPAETHYAMARAALERGKDVFVEKPLTIDVGEARDLVQRAESAGRLLMVGHLLEYHPAILRLHELIEAGELGEVRYLISNRLNLGKIRTEENALWSFAPHDIAVILRLVGALPREVVATGGCYVSPDIADVTVTQLRFDSEVRAHVFVSWLHPFKEQKLVVVGSRKMASFDDVAKERVLYDQRVDWQEGQPIPVRGEGKPVPFDEEMPLTAECRHFLDCIASRTPARTDGENGVRVLRILHAAQESLVAHGQPVTMDWSVEEAPVPTVHTVSAAAASRA
jgi:predicted dehydrogenase